MQFVPICLKVKGDVLPETLSGPEFIMIVDDVIKLFGDTRNWADIFYIQELKCISDDFIWKTQKHRLRLSFNRRLITQFRILRTLKLKGKIKMLICKTKTYSFHFRFTKNLERHFETEICLGDYVNILGCFIIFMETNL